jgi:hypothetical protein
LTKAQPNKPAAILGLVVLGSLLAGGIAFAPSPSHIQETRANLRIGVSTEAAIEENQELYQKGIEDFLQMRESDQLSVKSRFQTDAKGWLDRQRKSLVVSIAGRLEGIPAEDRSRYSLYREANAVEKWTVVPTADVTKEDPRETGYHSVMALECMASQQGIVAVLPWFKGYYSSDEEHPNYVAFEDDMKHDTEHTGMIMPPSVWLDTSTHEVMAPLLDICTGSR